MEGDEYLMELVDVHLSLPGNPDYQKHVIVVYSHPVRQNDIGTQCDSMLNLTRLTI